MSEQYILITDEDNKLHWFAQYNEKTTNINQYI